MLTIRAGWLARPGAARWQLAAQFLTDLRRTTLRPHPRRSKAARPASSRRTRRPVPTSA